MTKRSDIQKVLLVGAGPTVIGQAGELDSCGLQAIRALRDAGVEVVLLHSNAASVMTDPDVADRTYLEPITVPAAERILMLEKPDALVATFGGQTALELAKALGEQGVLARHGVQLLGASLETLTLTEDVNAFAAMVTRLGLQRPEHGVAASLEDAKGLAERIGYPVLVRAARAVASDTTDAGGAANATRSTAEAAHTPGSTASAAATTRSAVAAHRGARPAARDIAATNAAPDRGGMGAAYAGGAVRAQAPAQIAHDAADLERYAAAGRGSSTLLLERFLQHAILVDVDLVRDSAGNVFIGGVLEQIEEAGVHSGDAACSLPPHSLSSEVVERIKDQSIAVARELSVVGLLNLQFATQGKALHVLEANPRASRTVPFVSKVTGVPLSKVAALCLTGQLLPELGYVREAEPRFVAIREAVFPFATFSDTDVLLGPQMRSTGEVIGIGATHEEAFARSQLAAGVRFPEPGSPVFLSVKDEDKPAVVDLARRLKALGYPVLTTGGTQRYLDDKRVSTERVLKVAEGSPNVVDRITDGTVGMVINTTAGKQEVADGFPLRRAALVHGVPYFTTVQGARMAVGALELLAKNAPGPRPLQDLLATKQPAKIAG